jgi:Zn-dependent protease
MVSSESGSFRLFRFRGIQVFLHWSWFIVALLELTLRARHYSTPVWNVAEYLSLFGIVLLHEFGHAFACRQTGGEANEIVLWPLGGIAYVRPPPRAGAELWSIAAGPLVNVVLIPVIIGLVWVSSHLGWTEAMPDLRRFFSAMWWINMVLLIFNLLPVYPLDGGQILRSLLWFMIGRARSLQIATVIGLAGVSGIVALVVWWGLTGRASWMSVLWIGFMAAFLGQRCLISYRHSRALLAVARMPRHRGYACPACREPPPGGPLWGCTTCGNRFDPFSTRAICPHCRARQPATVCAYCGNEHPIEQWEASPLRFR